MKTRDRDDIRIAYDTLNQTPGAGSVDYNKLLDTIGKPTVSTEDTSEVRFATALAATTADEQAPKPPAAPGVCHDGKADQGKLRWSLLPWRGAKCVVRVMEHGAKKYGPKTWQSVPGGIERYKEALLRHMTALQLGEECDKESGLPHIWHVATNALFVAELEWKECDDILNGM